MNIFQDLVEELKEENLLEETVIEPREDSKQNQDVEKGPEVSSETEVVETSSESEESEETANSQDFVNTQDVGEEDSSDVSGTVPTEPTMESLDPVVEPTEPAMASLDPVVEPTEPAMESVDPGFEPTEPEMESLDPVVEPTEPAMESLDPVVEPTEPAMESLDPVVEPTEAAMESLDPVVEPTEPAMESLDPEVEPIEPAKESLAANVETTETAAEPVQTPEAIKAPEANKAKESKPHGSKFYKQRAMDEVTGLQLVEHVMSGVEREQMKQAPKAFDDLAVKRSLHDFLQVADDVNSPEHAQCEFQLMQETENWASALSRRDRNISVAHLRRFCETTKPRLSAQALISLARFYRNSPYSESVRGKFDLILTRLFSKEAAGDKRKVVFSSNEFVAHIQELYADWASIPLYSTDVDDEGLLVIALKFQDFVEEANTTDSFDKLVQRDFFKRLKAFKETTRESFFAPLVVAAAVECNVAVGNRYIELINEERKSGNSEVMTEKYSGLMSGAVSEATSKTIEIVELLDNQKNQEIAEEAEAFEEFKKAKSKRLQPKKPKTKAVEEEKPNRTRGILIAATVVMMIICAWVFITDGLGGASETNNSNPSAREFVLSGTPLQEHLVSARISKNTLFGITKEGWSKKTRDEKEGVLSKALEYGNSRDFVSVHFLDKEGKTVGYASKNKVEVK